MRARFPKAQHCALAFTQSVQCRAATRRRRRKVRGQDILCLDALPFSRVQDAVGDELAKCLFTGMLELAAATALVLRQGEVTARRFDMLRPCFKSPIGQHNVTRDTTRDMTTGGRGAIAARGNALDRFAFAHRNAAMACFTALAR